MKRREFIGLIASLGTWSVPAWGQQPKVLPRVVYLDGGPWVEGLLSGLRELGYVDGKNIDLVRIRAANSTVAANKEAIIASLDNVDVLVVGGTVGGVAAKAVTSTVPVVFISVGAPVDIGLVKSLARPGGNMTGVTFEATTETYAKRLQILAEIVPRLSRVAALGAKDDPNFLFAMTQLKQFAPTLQVDVTLIALNTKDDLASAFDEMKQSRIEALLVVSGGLTYGSSQTIADLALKHRLPSCHGFRETVAAGGLVSLGPDLVALARQGARLIDAIIKGRKPADIPVEQPDRYTLSVNLKTARTLGLTIPPALLARADEIIE